MATGTKSLYANGGEKNLIVTHRIEMDLARSGVRRAIGVVQDDRYSRNLEVALFSDGKPWPVPDNTTVMVNYRKSDGTGGTYDTLPDGDRAWSVRRNVLTIALAPQVLTVPGKVSLSAVLMDGNRHLNTFALMLDVQRGVRADFAESEACAYVAGFLPAPVSGKMGQYIQISAVGQNGNITAVEAADGGSGQMDYDRTVKAVNHRGYSATAPENTIPAFILSKSRGFNYVEADVTFTSDNVPVLLHDSSIDRTSDGSGNIYDMTYEEALQYDFGSWKGSAYAGTKIPTLEEFLKTCRALGLHPYIELKYSDGRYTAAQIDQIVEMVKCAGMQGKVTYISSSSTYLGFLKSADATARLGYVADVTDATIATAVGLKTGSNEVFMDVFHGNITGDKVAMCIENDLPLELWTVNSESVIVSMNPYVTGVTSDSLIAGKVLYDAAMVYDFDSDSSEDGEDPEDPDNSGDSGENPDDGGETVMVYSITSDLSNVTSSNDTQSVDENAPYTAVLTANEGYTLSSVTVTMGGEDITAGAYADGVVSIAGVTGNVVITAEAVEESIPEILPDALVEIDMANGGANIGTGGEAYNAAVTGGGAFADGKFVVDNESGALTVSTDFMAVSATNPWTVAFTIDTYEVGGGNYSRIARGITDVPSIYYASGYGAFLHKLCATQNNTSKIDWYDEDSYIVPDNGALVLKKFTGKTTIAFRNDGESVSLWLNGEMKARYASSYYTSNYWASTFSIGDNAAAGFSMAYMECSMLKLWDSALSDTAMATLI